MVLRREHMWEALTRMKVLVHLHLNSGETCKRIWLPQSGRTERLWLFHRVPRFCYQRDAWIEIFLSLELYFVAYSTGQRSILIILIVALNRAQPKPITTLRADDCPLMLKLKVLLVSRHRWLAFECESQRVLGVLWFDPVDHTRNFGHVLIELVALIQRRQREVQSDRRRGPDRVWLSLRLNLWLSDRLEVLHRRFELFTLSDRITILYFNLTELLVIGRVICSECTLIWVLRGEGCVLSSQVTSVNHFN